MSLVSPFTLMVVTQVLRAFVVALSLVCTLENLKAQDINHLSLNNQELNLVRELSKRLLILSQASVSFILFSDNQHTPADN